MMAGLQIMGIVNVTPDSFSDGGLYDDPDSAMAHARRLLAEGAHILDIGGESTRPGAFPVSSQEEQRRIMPVIGSLAAEGAFVSVDTRHANTMRGAIDAGARMVNDVTALTGDSHSLPLLASRPEVRVCLMHMQGNPATMQGLPSYQDVVSDVLRFLQERVQACLDAGIARERLILDPGIGFGKTMDHNVALLRNLHRFQESGLPVLVGLSRKCFIADILGTSDLPATDRLAGSLAAAIEAVRRGASILRVHDVAETRQALDVFAALHGNSCQSDDEVT
jgi:dihydropteroate synthase